MYLLHSVCFIITYGEICMTMENCFSRISTHCFHAIGGFWKIFPWTFSSTILFNQLISNNIQLRNSTGFHIAGRCQTKTFDLNCIPKFLFPTGWTETKSHGLLQRDRGSFLLMFLCWPFHLAWSVRAGTADGMGDCSFHLHQGRSIW